MEDDSDEEALLGSGKAKRSGGERRRWRRKGKRQEGVYCLLP
jgi:hypothetical protein